MTSMSYCTLLVYVNVNIIIYNIIYIIIHDFPKIFFTSIEEVHKLPPSSRYNMIMSLVYNNMQ